MSRWKLSCVHDGEREERKEEENGKTDQYTPLKTTHYDLNTKCYFCSHLKSVYCIVQSYSIFHRKCLQPVKVGSGASVSMAVVERRINDCRKTSYFLKYAENHTSQGGEDGILKRIFELVGTSPQPFCVDIGAWDGIHLSNTYTLLHSNGWGGMLCEADPDRCEVLSRLYADRVDIHCVNSLVDSASLMKYLESYSVDCDFEFLSIDIDGADYHLWKGLGDTYCPRVVCIEFNPTIPNHIIFIQANDTRIQQGSSLLALTELANTLAQQFGGYQLVCTTVFNAIFVRRDLCHLLPPSDFSLGALHATSMITDIFQTYDGELKICGPKKLLWHRTAINPQKIQPLAKKNRVFPFAPPHSCGAQLTRQFSDVECALTELVGAVNEMFSDGGVSLEKRKKGGAAALLLESFETMRNVGDDSLRAGQGALAVAVEGMFFSAVLASFVLSRIDSSSSWSSERVAEVRRECVRHVLALSSILEKCADTHTADTSNNSISHEMYENALHVLSHIPLSKCGDMLERYHESRLRLSLKLAGASSHTSLGDVLALTRRTHLLTEVQILKGFLFDVHLPQKQEEEEEGEEGNKERYTDGRGYTLEASVLATAETSRGKVLRRMGVAHQELTGNRSPVLLSSEREGLTSEDTSYHTHISEENDHEIRILAEDVGNLLLRACARVKNMQNTRGRHFPSIVENQYADDVTASSKDMVVLRPYQLIVIALTSGFVGAFLHYRYNSWKSS